METQKHGKELIEEAREEIKHAREALTQAKKLLGEQHQHEVFMPDAEVIAKGAHVHPRKHDEA